MLDIVGGTVLAGVLVLVAVLVVAGRSRPRVRRAGWYVLVSVGASGLVGALFGLLALVAQPLSSPPVPGEHLGIALLGGSVGVVMGVIGTTGAAAVGLAVSVVSRRMGVRFLGAVVGAGLALVVAGSLVFGSSRSGIGLSIWEFAVVVPIALMLGTGAIIQWPAGFLCPLPDPAPQPARRPLV